MPMPMPLIISSPSSTHRTAALASQSAREQAAPGCAATVQTPLVQITIILLTVSAPMSLAAASAILRQVLCTHAALSRHIFFLL